MAVYESSASPLRLAEQLTLGFGPDRDYCELSSYLLGQDARPVAGRTLHQLAEVLVDDTLCRGKKPSLASSTAQDGAQFTAGIR